MSKWAGQFALGLLIGLMGLAILAMIMVYIPGLNWFVPLSPAVVALVVSIVLVVALHAGVSLRHVRVCQL